MFLWVLPHWRLRNGSTNSGGRCRRQKNSLELSAALCYPLDRKRRLLLTDAPIGSPLQRWSFPSGLFTSQWEAPILVLTGWALFFSLVILVSVEKGKQRYNKATESDQQADHPYEYQNDICSCHWRHLPSYVFRQAGHWLGRLPPLSWVPWRDSTTIWQEFQ